MKILLIPHLDPQLVIIILLLILSGVFSASETALMTLTPAKVRTLSEAKASGSWYLTKLKKHHHQTLITILVGNNFVNIAASAMTTVMMTDIFGSAAVGIVTGVLTLIILVFGEVLPKSLATTYAKQVALTLAPPLYILGIILTPIIFVLDVLVKVVLKFLGAHKEQLVTDEELLAMASIGAEEGSIDEHERELIENILEFNDIHVKDIMTPRVHMDAMPEEYDLEEATEFMINKPHSRIPIYRENVDNIVGILSTKVLLKELKEHEHPDKIILRKIKLKTPLKVLESAAVHDLFHQFKTRRTHMAIVVDEHGGTAGLITMEDLLEELVGNIEDEQDILDRVKELDDGSYELSARVELDELEEITGLHFDYPGYKTLNFLLVEQLGKLPKKGQKIIIGEWEFKITQMYRHTILKVELRKLPSESKA